MSQAVDHGIVRVAVALRSAAMIEALKGLIESDRRLLLVASAEGAGEVTPMLERFAPDVLVIGISIFGRDSVEELTGLVSSWGGAVLLTGLVEAATEAALLTSTGARAFIPSTAPPGSWVAAIARANHRRDDRG